MKMVDVLVAGAGQGGAQVAISLRQAGFDGSILLVGEEAELPYERPPLSKAYLSGGVPPERLHLRPTAYWSDRKVNLALGSLVTAIAPADHVAQLSDGRSVAYRKLVWAAGGAPRPLPCPGAGLPGVHVVRTRAQVDALRREAEQSAKVVIIGGGYIGLETASIFAKQGKQVTVVEAMPRLLARVAGEAISSFYVDLHRRHGVDIRLGMSVAAIEGDDRARFVRLASGERLPADLVVAGIGLIPNIGPLAAAGAECSNGVDIDAFCRTSLPDLYALGDCANQQSRYAGGERVRLESVQNAVDQANHVARAILGEATRYEALPWFWSHQYELKLQTVGLSLGHDQAITRGDPTSGSFSVAYLRDGRLIAIDCVNRLQDFTQAKALVSAGTIVTPDLLADAGTSLKALAAAQTSIPATV